jgi:hypothetical protein
VSRLRDLIASPEVSEQLAMQSTIELGRAISLSRGLLSMSEGSW